MTPEDYAKKIGEWTRGTMIEAHGTRFLSAAGGRAVTELDFKPSLTQLTGLVHAGAIVAFADETATAAAMWETNPTAEFRPELFPLTLVPALRLGASARDALGAHRAGTFLWVPVSWANLVTRAVCGPP